MNDATKKWQDNSRCHKHSEGRHTFVAAMTSTKNDRHEVMLWMCSHCRQYSHTQEIQDANTANHDGMYRAIDA
jgi:hypothetical protein